MHVDFRILFAEDMVSNLYSGYNMICSQAMLGAGRFGNLNQVVAVCRFMAGWCTVGNLQFLECVSTVPKRAALHGAQCLHKQS